MAQTVTRYLDLGAWALEMLKASTAVCDLVVGGADGVMEAGYVSGTVISEAEQTRRDMIERHAQNADSRVLAVVVQDFGEVKRGGGRASSCGVFIYDRYGYERIRAAREAVISAIVNRAANFVRDADCVQVRYWDRIGHAIDATFDVDFERVRFLAPLVAELDIYA